MPNVPTIGNETVACRNCGEHEKEHCECCGACYDHAYYCDYAD